MITTVLLVALLVGWVGGISAALVVVAVAAFVAGGWLYLRR